MESAADLIKRDIIPFYLPGGEIYQQLFAASLDPNYQEISRRLVIPKDLNEYKNMMRKVTTTGMFAQMGHVPYTLVVPEEEHKNWYKSMESVPGLNPYGVNLSNKKWPLKKVFLYCAYQVKTCFYFQKYDINILRFTQVSMSLFSALLLTFSIEKQAGLLLYTKEFTQYVWEEELIVLTLPYFYLGIYDQLISWFHLP